MAGNKMIGKQIRRVVRRAAGRAARSLGLISESAIKQYLAGSREPWSPGYGEYRWTVVEDTLASPSLMRLFADGEQLPPGYGPRLDERVIEYPWVLARLPAGPSKVLDAGSTFNYPSILVQPVVAEKQLVIVTLAPSKFMERKASVSYLFDDLRSLILRDEVFDTAVCISTLEHIGLDNTLLYTEDARLAEHDMVGYQPALTEMRRVLKPGGRLLLTVPFGRAEDHGWLQQFDQAGISRIIKGFGGTVATEAYYRYAADGWQLSSAEACADLRYFNVHAARVGDEPPADGAAAARAVCCLELIRT